MAGGYTWYIKGDHSRLLILLCRVDFGMFHRVFFLMYTVFQLKFKPRIISAASLIDQTSGSLYLRFSAWNFRAICGVWWIRLVPRGTPVTPPHPRTLYMVHFLNHTALAYIWLIIFLSPYLFLSSLPHPLSASTSSISDDLAQIMFILCSTMTLHNSPLLSI